MLSCFSQVWDASLSHIPHKAAYILHPSFPVRRVLWRPGYECELAVVSNDEFLTGSGSDANSVASTTDTSAVGTGGGGQFGGNGGRGDAVEIWDVRRGWIAKWAIGNSAVEGGITGASLPGLFLPAFRIYFGFCRKTDIAFANSHALWAQHSSGTFSQLDVRNSHKPLDAIPRTSVSWEAGGALAFVSGRKGRWEIPFDDMSVFILVSSLLA